MLRSRVRSDVTRVLVLAVAFFGGLAFLAWQDGLFEKWGSLAAALGIFAAAFATFTVLVDRDIQEALAALLRRRDAKRSLGKRLRGHLR